MSKINSRATEHARSVLQNLIGTWRFELWSSGHDAPTRIGGRKARALFDDLRIEWRETFDGSAIEGCGLMGFDTTNACHYSFAVHNVASEPSLQIGMPDDTGSHITFKAIDIHGTNGDVKERSILQIDHRDQHTWIAQTLNDDGAWVEQWRAIFKRSKADDI